MSVFDERPWGMRRRRQEAGDSFRFDAAPAAQQTTRSGRKLVGVDNGTVALAISGMAFYWMMPAMLGRRRKKKRRPAPEAGSTDQT